MKLTDLQSPTDIHSIHSADILELKFGLGGRALKLRSQMFMFRILYKLA